MRKRVRTHDHIHTHITVNTYVLGGTYITVFLCMYLCKFVHNSESPLKGTQEIKQYKS